MSSSKNSAYNPLRTTVVGIGAQGNAEDWSSEFDLEVGNLLLRRKTSTLIQSVDLNDFDEGQDDIALTDSDEDTIPATNVHSIGSLDDRIFTDTDSLSLDEDWDAELGITDEVLESQESMLNGFRHVISDTLGLQHGGMLDELTKPSQVDEVIKTTIPARCKVVSMLLNRPDDVNMLVYPKSIPLYSLKVDGDKKQLMAMQLDDWLKNIVHKHKDRIDVAMKVKNINWLHEIQSHSKKFSLSLFNAWAEVLTVLWRNNSLEIYDMLKNFLKLFRQFSKMDKYVVKDLSSMSEGDYHTSFAQVTRILRITTMADVLESISGKYTDGAGKRNDHHFRMIITETSSRESIKKKKSNVSVNVALFPEILKCATVLFPDKLELLAVLELEAACHHVTVMLDNRIDSNYSPTPYDLFKAHIFLYRSISSAAREKTTAINALKADKKASRRDRDRYAEEMKNCDMATTAILCDMCLLMNGHESLNTHYSKHLSAAIDLLFVERDSADRSSDDSDEDNEDVYDVYTQAKSVSTCNNSVSRLSPSRSSKSSVSQPTRPRKEKDMKKFVLQATHTTTESIDAERKHGVSRSVSNVSKSVANIHSVSQQSKSTNHMSTRLLSQELLENDEHSLYDVFVSFRTQRYEVAMLLSKMYKKVSRKSSLKPIVAYTLGLLQSLEEDSVASQERIESLWLECLVLLDKQSDYRFSEVEPPVVTLFAVGVIESFAELLIKTSKYKFGVSSFEAVTECLLLLNSKDVKRLYRRLTNLSTEARDIKRSIYYHCVMMRIAIEEGKLNEFVYIADLIGKLFLEVGETQLAERCLRVVALLHQGYTIKFVKFERINLDKLLLNNLPEGIELPYIDLDYDKSGSNAPESLLWTRRARDSVQCDSQQLHAIMKLVEAYVVSDYHHMALALCSCLLEKKVFPQGRIHVLLTMAKCFLKVRELKKCEATLDRIAFEAEEIVAPLLKLHADKAVCNEEQQGTDEGGNGRGSTFVYGLQHNNSFSGGLDNNGSVRDVSKLTRIGSDKRKSKNFGRSGSMSFFNESNQSSLHHTSAALLGVVTKVRSYQYILLRARCRLAADDPEWAILWLQIAISICPQGKFDRQGRIRYLTGRAYMMLCLRCHMGGGAVPLELVEMEAHYASKAEEEFRAASALYKITGDIVKETKTLSRITELHVSRIFSEVAVEQSAPLHAALHGKADSTLRSLESLSRLAMQLAGDTSAPLELLRTLVNTAELSWLLGNVQLSFSAWYEAKTFLTITYLQCLSMETPPPPNIPHIRQMSSNPQKVKKTFSFGSLSSFNTNGVNTPTMPLFSPADFIPDPLNPLSDAPLAVVKFAPGMLLRIYALLTRLVRLAFVIEPSPLSHYGGSLLTSWTRLNNVVNATGCPLFADIHCSLKKSLSSFKNICRCYRNNSFNVSIKNKFTFSTEILDILSYICPDESERMSIIEKLSDHCSNQSKDEKSVEGKPNKRPPGDKLLEESVLVSSLTIMQPFEYMLRAFSVDGVEGVEVEGAKATDIVLNYVRESVSCALRDPQSEKAEHIAARGRAPGLTMTATGHFVEGVMDYAAAEAFVRENLDHFSEISKKRNLGALLKRNNDVYYPSDGYLLSESNAFFTEQQGEDDEHNSDNDDESGKLEDTMALLLGTHPKKSRIQVLFLRLKSFSEQYALGHLSLTDYYRNNMETLRSIVNAQMVIEDYYGTLAVKDARGDQLRMTRSFSNTHSPVVPTSNPGNKRSLIRSQTKEVMEQLEGGQDENSANELRKCYAPSFRFVVQLEPNSLMMYYPRSNHTATALFRNTTDNETNLHNTPVSYSRDCAAFYPGQDLNLHRRKKLRAQEVVCGSQVSSLRQHASFDGDRYSLDHIYSGVSSPLVGTSGESIMSGKQQGGLVLNLPTSKLPTNASEVAEIYTNPMTSLGGVEGRDVQNKSSTMLSALTTVTDIGGGDNSFAFLLDGLFNVLHNFTSPVSPQYHWSTESILSAFNSLPLPTEDIFEVKFNSAKSSVGADMKDIKDKAIVHEEEKYSVYEALCSLGLQRTLFLLNALMLEEPVLLVIAPGSEQLLVHVATALLRLLRPLQWQHLYLPLMQSTMYPQFRSLIENKECFLVGTYHYVLDIEVEAHRSITSKILSDKVIDPFCLPRLSHVTIVDLNSGRIKPSTNLVFAHLCTVFDPVAYDVPAGDASTAWASFFPEAANNPYFSPEQLSEWALKRESQLRLQEADIEEIPTDAKANPKQYHVKAKSDLNLFDLYAKSRALSSSSAFSQSSLVSEEISVRDSVSFSGQDSYMKPPIPVRYRSHIFERLSAIIQSFSIAKPAVEVLSKPFSEHSGDDDIKLSENVKLECSAVFLEAMFEVMISMFKGVKCFLRHSPTNLPPSDSRGVTGRSIKHQTSTLSTESLPSSNSQLTGTQILFTLSNDFERNCCQALAVLPGRKLFKLKHDSKLSKLLEDGALSLASMDAMSLPTIDEKKWISYLYDDCQAFARFVLHCKSFKLLSRDIFLCQQDHERRRNNKRLRVSDFFYAFMLRAHAKLRNKMKLYRSISTNRMAGYLITYFGRIDAQLESPFDDDEDDGVRAYYDDFNPDVFDVSFNGKSRATRPLPVLHTFPFTPARVKSSLKTIMNSKKEPRLKIKRRWCVLDGQRFTYFKSRSNTAAKSYVSMDPSQVRLVMTPFNHHPNKLIFPSNPSESTLCSDNERKIVENDACMTSISDAFALVCNSTVIVLRAEYLTDHNQWLLAFRSRLQSSDAVVNNVMTHDKFKDTTGLLSRKVNSQKVAISPALKSKINAPQKHLAGRHSVVQKSSGNANEYHSNSGQAKIIRENHESKNQSSRSSLDRQAKNGNVRQYSHADRPGNRGVIPTTKNTREGGGRNREKSRSSERSRRRDNSTKDSKVDVKNKNSSRRQNGTKMSGNRYS